MLIFTLRHNNLRGNIFDFDLHFDDLLGHFSVSFGTWRCVQRVKNLYEFWGQGKNKAPWIDVYKFPNDPLIRPSSLGGGGIGGGGPSLNFPFGI